MKRLAVITTHPIQYNAPLFALLKQRGNIQVKIFYTWGESVLKDKYDPGFNKNIEWDIPLLEGYDYVFVKNTSAEPGSHHFKGIDNPELVRGIEGWNADTVLVYGWAFKSHLKAIRYFNKKIPVLFRGDSTLLGQKNIFKKMARTIFLKWVYSHVDKALYVGTHNRNYFLRSGLRESQLVFVPHAVDNDRFSGNDEKFSEAAAAWREKLNIAAEEIVFLFAAKLDDNKNAALLIESFAALEKQNIHLVIAGNGDKEKQLYSAYEGYEHIHFLPFQNQSNMPVLYRVGDVFVIPSRSETWGLSINEAMACSRVILASNACGAAVDLVKDGTNGYVFESGNASDLKDKMQKCISDKNELKKCGAASFDLIKDWNYEHACKAIEFLVSTNNMLQK